MTKQTIPKAPRVTRAVKTTIAKAPTKRVRDVSYEDSLVNALTDPEEAAAYLAEVIAMQDQPALMLALRHVAKAHGMAEIARRAQLGDKTLFKVLSSSGNPTLETVSKVLNAVGLRLSVEAIPA
jgi:probable addiction module antidote protein